MRSQDSKHHTLAMLVVSCLFVISGATGLAYEVLWFKRFAQMWGGASASMAAVVACFLFGLGLGARLCGRLADRSERPLKLYALFELLIGLFALAIPVLIDLLFPLSSALYPALADSPLLFAVARFVVTFLVIGLPTVLMGATLPLLVRQFAVTGSGLGAATSWLYFVNSLGAAGGAWLAGFVLLPALGILWTNALVAATNLVVALVAFGIVGELPRAPVPARDDPEPADPIPARLVAASGLTGLGSIALQMVWARQLSLLAGGSTYAFTAVLFVFILGLSLGSLAFRLIVREDRQLPWVIGGSVIGIALFTLVGLELRAPMTEVLGRIQTLRSDPVFEATLFVAVSAVLQGIPTFFMGLLFPALVQLSRAGRERAGRTVGRLYAWNTAGSIVGATTTAAFLFPAIGTYGAAVAMLGLYGVAVLLLHEPVRAEPAPAGGRVPLLLGAAALVIGVGGGILARPDADTQKRLNVGAWLYTPQAIRPILAKSEILFLEEAPTANVMVLSYDASEDAGAPVDTIVNIRTNGKVDGGNAGDMFTQLGTAYLPRIVRPGSSDVLVIGFGTGTTAGASLLFPETRVDCCEIEPAMSRASEFFHSVNHQPELSPRYTGVVEDGRNYVQGTDRGYDLVISEPSNPWIAGVGNLYTVEFYRAVRDRLKPGGLLGQWIQAYSLSRAELALVVRTLNEVFEHVGLLRINDYDMMLLASPAPIVPAKEVFDRSQALIDGLPIVRDELLRHFRTSDVRALLLGHYVLDAAGLQRIVDADGEDGINTDANLRLEFDAPRHLFEDDSVRVQPVMDAVVQAARAEHWIGLIASWGWTREQLGALRRIRTTFVEHGHLPMAVALADLGLAYSSESAAPDLFADTLLYRPPDDLGEFRVAVRHLLGSSPFEVQRVAAGLGQRGDPVRAVVAYEELLAEMPSSATVYASLAVCFDQLGRPNEVARMVQKASELDPLNEATRVILRNLDVDALREGMEAAAGASDD